MPTSFPQLGVRLSARIDVYTARVISNSRLALVVVESNIARDPRVTRQIEWLAQDGWIIDSLGLGNSTAPAVRDHFPIADIESWKVTRPGTALIYGLLTHRKKFEMLTLSRCPSEVRRRVRNGEYALIILNDRHFAPWVAEPKDFTQETLSAHIHLDLHEYFVPTISRDTLWRRATATYYEWCRSQFANPAFTSRSTVNEGIARMYADELRVDNPAVIRNCPPFVDQVPSSVLPGRIRLIHHGAARWDRGLRALVDAVRTCGPRFELTLILVGDPELVTELHTLTADISDRVRIIPPLPMGSLSQTLNEYDLEVMFYEPTTKNLELALPNKLFEAVQARLGLVTGPSAEMVKLIDAYGNGAVTNGWATSDLVDTLSALDEAGVAALKSASHAAARELNAETEQLVFRAIVSSAVRQ